MNFKIIALLLAFYVLPFHNIGAYAMQKTKHIVLLGASVGKAWNIESLPNRIRQSNTNNSSDPINPKNLINYRFEYVGEYQFDKSKALQQILQRKENKPDAIFIKECAAYFPGDFPHYQELMKRWIRQCQEAKIIPNPTTVVPVIKDMSLKTKIKDYIKRYVGKSPNTSRLTGILQYNDWIKSYAQKEGLTVLDLETPLRTSNKDRSLRIDFHSGDGLHLNSRAYTLLDSIVLPTLERVFIGKERSM